MTARNTKNQLLAGTSALALVAALSVVSAPAYAQLATVTTSNAVAQTANGNAQTATFGDGAVNGNDGTSTVAGPVISTGANTAEVVLVENHNPANFTTTGIIATGANNAVTTGGLAGSFASITVGNASTNGGTISSGATSATGGTITLDGSVAVATAINTGVNGTITGSGASGNAIYVGTAANQTGTITNAGTISQTGTGTAINIGSKAGNNETIINTGNITATGGTAINVGALSVAEITNTSGTITGAINLGAGTTGLSTIAVNGGAINGNITMGKTTDTLTLGGGQVTGTIDSAGAITVSAGTGATNTYTAAGAIGGGAAVTSLTINDGKTFVTTGIIHTTGAITVGSTATGGSTLTIGAGVITAGGGITNNTANTNFLNITDNQVYGGGAIGANAFKAITVSDSKTFDNTVGSNVTASTAAPATSSIILGTSTAGATWNQGGGTVTGIIDGSTAGKGVLILDNNATTTLGASTTVGANKALATVQVTDGSTLDAAANNAVIKATNITVGTAAGAGTGILKLGTGAVTGTIDGAIANGGTVNFTDNNVTNGSVGSTNGLSAVNITTGKEVNLATNNNALKASTITLLGNASQLDVGTSAVTGNVVLTAASVLDLNSTGTVSGTIDGTAANGIVNVAGTQTAANSIGSVNGIATLNDTGSLTLGSTVAAVKATNINVSGTGILNFGTAANHTIAGTGNITLSNTATLNLGTKATTDANGTLTTAATNTIGVTINSATSVGNLTTNTVSFATGTKVNVNLATTNYIANGTKFDYLDGAGAATNAAGTITSTNSQFVTFTDDNGTAGHRQLDAVVNTFQSVATTADTQAVGTTLSALGTTGNAQLSAFQAAVQQTTTAAAATNLLKQAGPQANGGVASQIVSSNGGAIGQSLNVVGDRLQGLRAGIDDSSGSGMAAGGAVADKGIWFQAFGTAATQDLRSGVDGYDATTGGGAVGADMAVGSNARAGLSFSYARTNVDSNGSASQSNDINTYQLNAYGSYNLGQWYTDGLLGVAYNDNSTDRNVTGSIASASFGGETYTARVGGGYRYKLASGLDITPNASLTYFYNHEDSYTESGAGGLDLSVNANNTNALIGRIGADFGYDFQTASALIRPVVRAGYSYDFVGDQVSTTSTFTGGGAAFTSKDASPERNAFDVGASLNVVRTDNVTFSADYDFQAKSGYDSNSGVLRARFNF